MISMLARRTSSDACYAHELQLHFPGRGQVMYQGVHEAHVPEARWSGRRLIVVSVARGVLAQLLPGRQALWRSSTTVFPPCFCTRASIFLLYLVYFGLRLFAWAP